MNALTTRRATRRRLALERAALRSSAGVRVRVELAMEHPTAHASMTPRALLAAVGDLASRVAAEAQHGPHIEGSRLTISGRLPRPTSRGVAWDTVQLAQLVFRRGQWWRSCDGTTWTPCELSPSTAQEAAP